MAVSLCVCVHCLSNDPWVVVKAFAQSHCTIQNKVMLIVIDLTINSCEEFEFTVKTMNALLSESSTGKSWNLFDMCRLQERSGKSQFCSKKCNNQVED